MFSCTRSTCTVIATPMNRENNPSSPFPRDSLFQTMKNHAVLLFGLIGTMWAVEISDLLPFAHLDRFGIQPRTLSGLVGILCAPFLHAGFGHLLANTIPFLVLGGIVLLGGSRVFWSVTLLVILMGGLGVWLFAPKFTNHVGASGVIFGYFGFLMARGFFERSVRWILTACAIFVLYGGLLFGVLPLRSGVSWQGHLFGFLGGIIAARLLFSPDTKLLR